MNPYCTPRRRDEQRATVVVVYAARRTRGYALLRPQGVEYLKPRGLSSSLSRLFPSPHCRGDSEITPRQLTQSQPSPIFKKVRTRFRRPRPHKWCLVDYSSPFVRLADHPHGARRLGHAIFAWWVKARPAPFRHCRGARVNTLWSYDHGYA